MAGRDGLADCGVATGDRTELGILTSLVYVKGLALATGDDTAGGDGLTDCGAATGDHTELGILTSLVYVNGLVLATCDGVAGGDGLAGCGREGGHWGPYRIGDTHVVGVCEWLGLGHR